MEEFTITQSRKNNEHSKKFNCESILQIIRSRKDNKKAKIRWNWSEITDKYIFFSAEQRERFCEYALIATKKATKKPVISSEELDIFIGTWNMGEAAPPENIETWIPKDKHDIYVISTQECEYPPRRGLNSCETDWFDCLTTHLGKNYIKLSGLSLLSIRLVIFIRRDHFYKISYLEQDTVATGIGGVIGNKGGVLVSFKYLDTSFCFIGSHLAARQKEIENRNANYRDIIKSNKIGIKGLDIANQFDYLFWCGDLNYRIDMERSQVLNLITEKQYSKLLEYDQLNIQRNAGNAFYGFNEATITFQPTYRYNRGDRTYSDEKMRTPSWCDRILFKTKTNSTSLSQLTYSSVDDLTTSDHSPVNATFIVKTHLESIPHIPTPCKIVISNLRYVYM